MYGVNDIQQREIQTAEPLVPELSAFEVETATEKLKTHTSPGINHITAELIRAAGRTIRSEIHELIYSIWNKRELPEQWKESIIVLYLFVWVKTQITVMNYEGISLLSTTYRVYQTSFHQG
jgi:hypothetical protein